MIGDKKALVRRLRFPEFRDAGEWEVKKAKFLFSNRVEQGKEGLPIYSVTVILVRAFLMQICTTVASFT